MTVTDLFRTVLNMSITGSWVILAVLLTRLLLKKAPKGISCALWAVAGFRLCCPVSFEAVFSLFRIPAIRTVSAPAPAVQYTVANPPEQAPLAQPEAPQTAGFDWMGLLAILWLVGMAAMLLYTLVSDLMLRRKLRTAVRVSEGIYRSEHVDSPFIFGILRPRIYLPYGLTEEQEDYVLRHERCHLKRCDHISKLAAYLILTVHWFNPLCHVAFRQFSRDMEMSCDEHVLGQNTDRKAYSEALVSVAADRGKMLTLSFGETAVKQRIQNILRWKKSRAWTVVLAVLLCAVVILACAADPVASSVLEDGVYLGVSATGEDFNIAYTTFYHVENDRFTLAFGEANYDVDLNDKQWEDAPYDQAQWELITGSSNWAMPQTLEGCRYMLLLTETTSTLTNISPGNTDETVPTTFARTVFLLEQEGRIYLCSYSENFFPESGEPVGLRPYIGATCQQLIRKGSQDDPLPGIFRQLDGLVDALLEDPDDTDSRMELLRSRHTVLYICDALKNGKVTGEKGELIAQLYADILERRQEDPRAQRGNLSPKAWIEASLEANREHYAQYPLSNTVAPLQMLTFLEHYYR